MTRLTENDIAGIEAEWATYERRLEELTGDDLLTLAARTLGIDPETARRRAGIAGRRDSDFIRGRAYRGVRGLAGFHCRASWLRGRCASG